MMTTGEMENRVLRDALNELRVERPDLWPLVQQWLETPTCLHLIHFLSSSPRQWLALADLAGQLDCNEEDVRAALACLIGQRIVRRLEIPDAGAIFYQLSDREPEREKVAYFRDWSQRWSAWLEATHQLLGRGWHWGEKRERG